jgi:hypothetical protein
LRTNGSRECAPDDRLREAIHIGAKWIDGLLRRKRFAFVAGNDGEKVRGAATKSQPAHYGYQILATGGPLTRNSTTAL